MEKILFIVNPISGGKKKDRIVALAKEIFPDAGIAYTERAGHATEIARATDAGLVVAVGGDGTVNEVARGLVDSDKAFSIVPCGSGDGLALHLGLSRNHRKALLSIRDGRREKMDYGVVNGRPFFCTTGVGFDALIGYEFAHAKRRGLITYVSKSVKNWFGYKPDTYKVTVDGNSWSGPAVLITVGNADQWGNNARICGGSSVQDGSFFITIVKPFRTPGFIPLLFRLMTGKVEGARKTVIMHGAHVQIERGKEGPAHYDGEPFIEGTSLDVQMHAAALNVVVPRKSRI